MEHRTLDPETELVILAGELGLEKAPALEQLLVVILDSGKKRLLVDLSDVTYIDSAILGVLVGASKRLVPQGGGVTIACPDENIRQVLEITELDRVFEIVDSLDP